MVSTVRSLRSNFVSLAADGRLEKTDYVMPNDRDNWISNTNYEAIAARPERFEELLVEVPPEQKRDAILGI